MLCWLYSNPSGIKDEEDTQMLRKDLHNLYKWADTNNMKFNANKFELVWYGNEHEIKIATTYKSYDDSNIDGEQVRDIGIMMSNTATFTLHISNIVKKARYSVSIYLIPTKQKIPLKKMQ